MALSLRACMEFAELLAWSPHDPVLTARVMMAKRWVMPVSYFFSGGWMVLFVLSRDAMERQLRQAPLPVKMFARLHMLKRPIVAVVLSAGIAFGVAWAR